MNVQELEDKHLIISDMSLFGSEDAHARVSIEFAIEQLEELIEIVNDNTSDNKWWYEMKLEDKVNELKKYL